MKKQSPSDLAFLLVLLGMLVTAGQINLANAQEPRATIPPKTEEKIITNDFSWIRGANYVPSYARNDVQIWMDYDPEVIDRELSYAKKMKLNSVRIFLQYAVYKQNPKQFLARYENFLSLCEKHGIQAMIVVFDSCFGEYPDLQIYRNKDWMANPGQNMLGPEYWPELEKYVHDVCGEYRGDKRIVMWDVMNEPFCTSWASEEEEREKIWTFLDHFLDEVGKEDPTHPRTVGFMSSGSLLRLIDKIDVLGFHNYTGDMKKLQADISYVKALGGEHSKPVLINEIAHREKGQHFWKFMPILKEEGIGWYFWELMLGSTSFSRGNSPIQGVVYPDGTCRNLREIAAIMNIGEEEAKRLFPQVQLLKVTDKNVTYTGFWPRLSVDGAELTLSGRWSTEKAQQWYDQQPWLVGCNFTPSTAINQLEMWQADTFDPETIDRELGWAADMGMNTIRVYLHDLLWQQDSKGFLKRIDQFLGIADKHDIKTMLVLCDSVWNPHPKLGKQPSPKPHLHNSGWVQSPHIDILKDIQKHNSLEPYFKGVIGRFKDDRRVLIWDLYNEPGNDGKEDGMTTQEKEAMCLILLEKMLTWARQVNPSQPLTTGLWSNEWVGPKATRLNRFILANSDIISFHIYDRIERTIERVGSIKLFGRPLLCTEYMVRRVGSGFKEHLPYFKKNKIAAYNWGLVAGKIQTQYPWASWRRTFTAEPKVWFHDVLRPDGTPYDQSEVDLIKSLTKG